MPWYAEVVWTKVCLLYSARSDWFHNSKFRWQNAGRMRDIISELISASSADVPTELPPSTSLKRHRENEGNDGAPPSDFTTTVNFPSNATATSTFISEPCSTEFTEASLDTLGLPSSLPSVSDFDWNLFAHGLPLHTEDLGRLPVHLMTGVESDASRGFDTQGARLYGQYSDNLDSIAPYLQHSAHGMSGITLAWVLLNDISKTVITLG